MGRPPRVCQHNSNESSKNVSNPETKLGDLYLGGKLKSVLPFSFQGRMFLFSVEFEGLPEVNASVF